MIIPHSYIDNRFVETQHAPVWTDQQEYLPHTREVGAEQEMQRA